LSYCNTLPSFYSTYPLTHTHTLSLSFFALLVLPHTHIISLFSSLSLFFMLSHTHLSSFFNKHKKGRKAKKKNLFGMHEEASYC
jgi:hypothetical protein